VASVHWHASMTCGCSSTIGGTQTCEKRAALHEMLCPLVTKKCGVRCKNYCRNTGKSLQKHTVTVHMMAAAATSKGNTLLLLQVLLLSKTPVKSVV
jgi:hypothetical protein